MSVSETITQKHIDSIKDFAKKLLQDYINTEEQNEFISRRNNENNDIQRVIRYIKEGISHGETIINTSNSFAYLGSTSDLARELTVGGTDFSALMQLLKAADNISLKGKENYLDAFIDIPEINALLLALKNNAEAMRDLQNNVKYKTEMRNL